MTSLRSFLTAFFLLTWLYSAGEQPRTYFVDPDTVIQRRLEEWKDLKFGLLMHWGAYSQWNIVESWSICPEDLSWATGARKKEFGDDYSAYRKKYEELPTTFNPTAFDPGRWADAAKQAGMRYVVFTTKHHDGFCMWDTKLSDYKITAPDCPFSNDPRRDVTREIFRSFRERGFWVGAYFSKPDWHSDYYWWKKFPPVDRNANYSIAKYPEQWQKFVSYTHGQIKELLSDYGKVDLLWLDGGWVRKKSDADIEETLTEIYEGSRWARNPQSQDIDISGLAHEARALQREIIIVDRDVPGPYQNYLTPEQQIPDSILPYPWETCMTMANSWSYVATDTYKPTEKLIKTLVDVVSKGGNLLLNIGPSPTGEFAPEAYDRLEGLSNWMIVNQEAIYATRPCERFREGDDIRFTRSKDGRVTFAFLFNTDAKDVLLSSIPYSSTLRISMLGSMAACSWKSEDGKIRVRLPGKSEIASQHVWVLRIEK